MNYVDATLIKLADSATRVEQFDSLALEQLVAAGYDTEAMTVEGPFQPLFDEFRLGLPPPRLGVIEGVWNPVGGVERTEARFQLSGIGNDSGMVRVDAFWRGNIVARTVPETSLIQEVQIARPDLGTIDAEIEADLGALPTEEQALEEQRRARFLTRVRNGLNQPTVLTDEVLDNLLSRAGATSVGDFLTGFHSTAHTSAVQVTFSPPSTAAPSPKPLPIAAALLIRDAGFSVAQLLMESKMVREQIKPLGLERQRDPSLRLREPVLVVWVIPITVFDDPDWPGATGTLSVDQARRARRVAAGQWLAAEGIGLVATASLD